MATNKDWESLIHELARTTKRLIFTIHALEQMCRREISMAMALDTLRSGQIARPPQIDDNTGDMKCRLEHYCAGESISVVAAVQGAGANQVIVITAFRTSEEKHVSVH
jgi:Domain of unknown function (DUF4258)